MRITFEGKYDPQTDKLDFIIHTHNTHTFHAVSRMELKLKEELERMLDVGPRECPFSPLLRG